MQRRDEIVIALVRIGNESARLESERFVLARELEALANAHAISDPNADLATYKRRTTPESRRAYYEAVCAALCAAPSVLADHVPLKLLLTANAEPPLPLWMQRLPRFNIAGEEVQGAVEPLHSRLLESVLEEFNGCFRGVRVRYARAGAESPYAMYTLEAVGGV